MGRFVPQPATVVKPFDLRESAAGHELDILDRAALDDAARDCDGIIHLAAISRVADAELDPHLTWKTNATGTRNVLRAARRSPRRPWVLLASSREVYGQTNNLPAREDHPLEPVNVYGRSKAEAEYHLSRARRSGLTTAVVRLTNIYGVPDDHPERAVPAFIRGVLEGRTLRVDGNTSTLDLLHIDDGMAGILLVVEQLESGVTDLPALQLVSGRAVTIGELARMCVEVVGRPVGIHEHPPGEDRVHHFVGDPARAGKVLGWKPGVSLEQGLRVLARALDRRSSVDVPTGALGREAR